MEKGYEEVHQWHQFHAIGEMEVQKGKNVWT